MLTTPRASSAREATFACRCNSRPAPPLSLLSVLCRCAQPFLSREAWNFPLPACALPTPPAVAARVRYTPANMGRRGGGGACPAQLPCRSSHASPLRVEATDSSPWRRASWAFAPSAPWTLTLRRWRRSGAPAPRAGVRSIPLPAAAPRRSPARAPPQCPRSRLEARGCAAGSWRRPEHDGHDGLVDGGLHGGLCDRSW